ncbi:MAG: hypothetical protein PHH00_03095 [Candidatus Nanoarchaeia archaeon]|nr:hypothetical protein [Candidatus Nanoarchaeia archaeon]
MSSDDYPMGTRENVPLNGEVYPLRKRLHELAESTFVNDGTQRIAKGFANELEMGLKAGENPARVYAFLVEQVQAYKEQARARGELKDVSKRFSEIESFVLEFYSRHSEKYKSLIQEYGFERQKNKSRAILGILRDRQFSSAEDAIRETKMLKELLKIMTERKTLYALRVVRDRVDGANALLGYMKNSSSNYSDYLDDAENQRQWSYGLHPMISANSRGTARKSLKDFLEERNLLPEDYRKLRQAILKDRGIFGAHLKNAVLRTKGFSYGDLSENERNGLYDSYIQSGFSKSRFAKVYGLRNVRTLNRILEDYTPEDEQASIQTPAEVNPDSGNETGSAGQVLETAVASIPCP